MKCMRVVLLGVLIVMLMAVPVLAEKKSVNTYEDILTGGTDATTFIPSEGLPDTVVVASTESGGEDNDSQSPVLDGSAYTNYDTFFVHGTNAEAELPDSDVTNVRYRPDYFDIRLIGKTSDRYPNAEVSCPVPSYQLKTGGIQPRVRYIAVEYLSSTWSSATGHAWPEVYEIRVYNGHTRLITVNTTFSSPSWSVQIIDLGGWYAFDRGMNIDLLVRNGEIPFSTSGFYLSGYAARFEW